MTPAVALTAGDPAGVGPELLVRLLRELRGQDEGSIVVVSSEAELAQGLMQAGFDADVDQLISGAQATLEEVVCDHPGPVGDVSAASGRWALMALNRALELHADGRVAGLQFGPLNKTSLHLGGMTEPDEMRWFEARLGPTASASEVNVSTTFWTSRVTSHVALREVADLVTAEAVRDSVLLLHGLLSASGVARPRLAVCALNPHAGEHGLFGDEEITAIAPGIALAAESDVEVSGPFPCDTLFRRGFDGTYDGIVTMYHDQGQIALKTRAFDGGVTLEAGLALPICTPAHGTAFDIVGSGRASLDSTLNAYRLLCRLVGGAS
ncbi:PdxA family dehydrogenase [Microbacterium sp. MAHUQ-60]|uniref:PdxA family dehydrogenase n=1 Tax=unclassified Microbacterium TaxID=2609290 RepID=UPI00360C6013